MAGRRISFPLFAAIELIRAASLFYSLILRPWPPFGLDMALIAVTVASAQVLPALAWLAARREGESEAFLSWILVPAHSLNIASGLGLALYLYRAEALVLGPEAQARKAFSIAFGALAFFLEMVLLSAALISLRKSRAAETSMGMDTVGIAGTLPGEGS